MASTSVVSTQNNDEDLQKLTVEELRKRLDSSKVDSKGAKAVLVNRLRQVLNGTYVEEKKKEKKGVKSSGDRNKKNDDGESDESIDSDDPIDDSGDHLAKQVESLLKQLRSSQTGEMKKLRERLRKTLKESSEEESDGETEDDIEVISRRKTKIRKKKKNDKEDDEEEDEEDEEEESPRRTRNRREKEYKRPAVRLDELDGFLKKFSGEKGEDFNRWLQDFEEAAMEYRWSEMYKKIYANRLLSGAALLFMHSVTVKSWKEWTEVMLEEFTDRMDSRKVHQLLATLEKKKEESYLSYVYRAVEIANRASVKIETSVTIDYIIAGIKEDEAYKVMLYSAESIKELKKRLKEYEDLKENLRKNKVAKNSEEEKRKRNEGGNDKKVVSEGEKKKRRCYSCGNSEHVSSECPDKDKGAKCFKCGEYGHISPQCTKDKEEKKSGGYNETPVRVRIDTVNCVQKEKTYKEVKVQGQAVKALIDSGSDLHIARPNFYLRLGAPPLEDKTVSFGGMGSTNMCTLGRFKTNVDIDGVSYPLEVDLVPNGWTDCDLLIGNGLFKLAEVTFKKDSIVVKKIDSTVVNNEDEVKVKSGELISGAKEINKKVKVFEDEQSLIQKTSEKLGRRDVCIRKGEDSDVQKSSGPPVVKGTVKNSLNVKVYEESETEIKRVSEQQRRKQNYTEVKEVHKKGVVPKLMVQEQVSLPDTLMADSMAKIRWWANGAGDPGKLTKDGDGYEKTWPHAADPDDGGIDLFDDDPADDVKKKRNIEGDVVVQDGRM